MNWYRSKLLSAWERVGALVACLTAGLTGIALLSQHEAYAAQPAYDSIREISSIEWWGISFLAAALVAGVAAITRRRRLYTISMTMAGVTSTMWFMGLFWSWRVEGLPTPGASLALWLGAAILSLSAAIHPPLKVESSR